ncbi:hypothetical protein SDC9_121120 [bioreactor metagenome]|uniref:Uncharacterized protein n=1 Tax=bioreactor metagenome TaxID=1076179 RepID=A0A645CB39_9ZZZZ
MSRKVFFESLSVLPFLRGKVVIADDKASRLYAVDVVVNFTQSPVEIGRLVPLPVKPYCADLSVVGQQFGKLIEHEPVVGVPVSLFGASYSTARASDRKIVGSPPVELGVIEMQFDSLLVASIRELFDDVALERCAVHNVIRRLPGMKHRKAIVMA